MNNNSSEIRYLSPIDITKKTGPKYCRFKKLNIKYIDYKDPNFLMRFLNEQGKILPRRITGNSLKFQRKFISIKFQQLSLGALSLLQQFLIY